MPKTSKNYFMTIIPNIDENEELRDPQKIAYSKAYEHFIIKKSKTDAIIVLPTGVGKTGLMALLPYGIAKGRVLIITPQLVIKDSVIGSLDPDFADNFWITQKIFDNIDDLPCLIEFEGKETRNDWLDAADIVVVNIQKLQERLAGTLMKRVPTDYFDMIIIDEAHHSTATTWVDTLRYFSNAKVIKLTGTPFRTDEEKIVGEIIYEYKLSAAMAHNYVKSLENFTYIPGEIYLTIDGDKTKTYTVEQLLKLNLKDEQWISRTVAYSEECSEKLALASIKKLEEKLDKNTIPHKIIAVACSISHAEQIYDIYAKYGYKSTIIHSGLEKNIIREALSDVENHRVQVVIHVAMLGEGYDHPYLSIAAIFRPFRSQLPYAQFVGRVLRAIKPTNSPLKTTDNIAAIITHRDMFLDKLWQYYKQEMQESETIKRLDGLNLDDFSCNGGKEPNSQIINKTIGTANETGSGTVISDAYINSELIEMRRKEEIEELSKLSQIQELLNINAEDARKLINTAKGTQASIKRPDLYIKRKRKGIDSRIKDEIVPHLLTSFALEKDSFKLAQSRLAKGSNSWIVQKTTDNAGFLAIYITVELNRMIGCKRDEWTDSDWEIAEAKLSQIKEYIIKILEGFTKKIYKYDRIEN